MCVEASGRLARRALANQDNVDDALAAAVKHAALEGIFVAADEPDLIRSHQSGAIEQVAFQTGWDANRAGQLWRDVRLGT